LNQDHDKLLHFFYGSVISFILIIGLDITGIIISFILPGIKELYYDKFLKQGNMQFLDYIYSIIPTMMFVIIKYLN
jgi:hypothetical protein